MSVALSRDRVPETSRDRTGNVLRMVRHGLSEENVAHGCDGNAQFNAPLCATGIAQSRARAHTVEADVVACSCLTRAMTTALLQFPSHDKIYVLGFAKEVGTNKAAAQIDMEAEFRAIDRLLGAGACARLSMEAFDARDIARSSPDTFWEQFARCDVLQQKSVAIVSHQNFIAGLTGPRHVYLRNNGVVACDPAVRRWSVEFDGFAFDAEKECAPGIRSTRL